MTVSTRTRPTNKFCTDCGEEVRLLPALFDAAPAAEHCSCTRTLPADQVEPHRIRAWRPL